MAHHSLIIFFSVLTIFVISHFTTSSAQSSPAQAPSQASPAATTTSAPTQSPTSTVPLVQAPPAAKSRRRPEPTNVTEILEKAGGFSVFIRLLRSTDVITQIENNLNASNSLTVLAPTNGGFSALKPGTLNALSPQQKAQLIDFHVLPTFIALQNFQTLTNPIRTQASNTKDYPLNVTTDGSSVNISTGVINTTISGTVYSDNQLAIYRVDSVLLPRAIFTPKASSLAPAPAPAQAPAASKPKKEASSSATSESSDSATSSSSSKPSSASTAASSTSTTSGSEGQVVTASDVSGAVDAAGNGALSFGFALIAVVFVFGKV